MRITKLQLDGEGVWTARVTVGEVAIDVDRRYGSWRVLTGGAGWRECLPEISGALQAKVRPLERKQRRAQEVQAGDVA